LLVTNLSGYPTRPSINTIRYWVRYGGKNPFDVAVHEAVKDQTNAGVDMVTDGQVRDMISIFALNVPGMEPDDEPVIRNRLSVPSNPTTLHDFVLAIKETNDPRRVKAVLPGPYSFIERCKLDIASGYEKEDDINLIFDVAEIIKFEIGALRDYGALSIQIVESAERITNLEVFIEWLNTISKKVRVPICHIDGNIGGSFLKLLDAKIKVLSFDLISYPKNRTIVKFAEQIEVYEKVLALGCVDALTDEIEPLYKIEKRISEFLDALGYDAIWVSPNASLSNLHRDIALKKLETLRDLKVSIVKEFV
jgi:5-methyltetrahydropteroyltriglutamate--homocysteine methyltransferase